jgi:hypothetical protein
MLAQQEPFPAVVVDRRWNLIEANRGAARLVEFLLGPFAPDARVNLADALLGPDALRPFLVNWAEVARYFIRGVEADAAADGTAETAALLERLLSYEGVRPLLEAAAGPAADPVLPMVFGKGEVSLELFTTIATLGTPQDVTLEELRIESFFRCATTPPRSFAAGPPAEHAVVSSRKRAKPADGRLSRAIAANCRAVAPGAARHRALS